MRLRTRLLAILALLTAITIHAAQKSDPAKVMFEAAKKKELVDGDLSGAIQQYKAIVSKFATERAEVADALIRMAECYHKLGDSESKKIYERVLREYSDQKRAVEIARAHVSAVEPVSVAKGDRAVWSGALVDGFGTVSRDGRFLTYTDWAKAAVLTLRDLTSGTDRRLTDNASSPRAGALFSAISKDGKQVAYEWYDQSRPDELRIAVLQGTGIPEYHRLVQDDEIPNISPMDWSPDGKWIAARLTRKDRSSQIALVSTQDGAVRVLKTTDWSDRDSKLFFSPDGKYLAYALTSGDGGNNSSIFVIASDGSHETVAIVHPSLNQVMAWSPDGKHLLFASDRSGSIGLWAVPMSDGKPQGQPVVVRSDLASTWSLGITASGTLYTWKNTGSTYVQVSSVDLNSGRLLGPSTGVFQRFIQSRGRPEWSADGKQVAFMSCGLLGGGPCSLYVWSRDTGQVRELTSQLHYFQFLNWSKDGRELLAGGTDPKGKKGIYRIDSVTGATSLIIAGDALGYAQWAPDGRSIYYRANTKPDLILKRDLATGAEAELVRVPAGTTFFFSISPDPREIVFVSNQPSSSEIVVIPLETGQARSVFHVSAPEHIVSNGHLSWTADGRAVMVMKSFDDNPGNELWEIPTDGRRPRKLDIDVTNWETGGFRLSPDGKQLVFVAGAAKSDWEIWALENLTPPLKVSK